MSLYTKKGDTGTADLTHEKQISKAHPCFCALGDLDELSCWIGMALCHNVSPQIRATLRQTQINLQRISSCVADAKLKNNLTQELNQQTEELEEEMDELERSLPPLKDFVLPGGTPTTSTIHLCRAVCRRAERSIVALLDEKKIDACVVKYLNRLSDYLFVCARKTSSNLPAPLLTKK